MATNTSVCSICDLRHITKSSTHWCQECEEALCSECSEHHSLSKASRAHKTIPISQYKSLPTFITDIQQFCIYHKEKYQQYCVDHERPICYKCIKQHGQCDEVVPIEEVVSTFKTSELFQDIEQSLKDMLGNIKSIREDRETNVNSINIQKKQIILQIDNIQTQLNQHLDKLKCNFIAELEHLCQSRNDSIQAIIDCLLCQEKEIKHCNTEIKKIKKYASDLQTFLCMKDIQSKVIDNEKRLKSMIENKHLEYFNIELSIDDKVQDFLTSVKKLGSIVIQETPSTKTNMPSKKTRQAQISIPNRNLSINTISVNLKQKLVTESPAGCSMTLKGGFLFVDGFDPLQKLLALNHQGTIEYVIEFPNQIATFVESLNENTVAVSLMQSVFGSEQYAGISIYDLTTKEVIKFIKLPGNPCGLSHDSTSLICCVEDKELHVISRTDYSITTIPKTVLPGKSYVTTHNGKIYLTNPKKHTISCCLYDGTQLWKFKDAKVLKTPHGITVDDKGNVFVVGKSSCNVLVISLNGKICKEILTSANGIDQPIGIFLNKSRNRLLVANETKDAYFYKISYS